MSQTSLLSLRNAVVMCVIYIGVGFLSQAIVRGGSESLPVWLAAGTVFGILLALPGRNWLSGIVGSFVGAVIWAMTVHGLAIGPALVFACIEIGAIVVGVRVAQVKRSGVVSDTERLCLFLAGAALSAVLGATLAGELWRWQHPSISYGLEWQAWAFSTGLGILIVAPLILEFSQFQVRRSGGLGSNRFVAGAVAFILFVVITWIVFGNDIVQRFGTVAPTLAYLPMPFLIISAIFWGSRGGALAVLSGSLLIVVRTAAGGGPFAIADSSPGEAVVEAQAFIAIWCVLVLLISALIGDRRRALDTARSWQLRYERVLTAAGVATVEVDVVSGRILWGDDAAAVLGTGAALVGNIYDWWERVEIGARQIAQSGWDAASNGHRDEGATYSVDLGGRRIPISVSWSPVRGPDGAVELIAGLIRVPADATMDGRNV